MHSTHNCIAVAKAIEVLLTVRWTNIQGRITHAPFLGIGGRLRLCYAAESYRTHSRNNGLSISLLMSLRICDLKISLLLHCSFRLFTNCTLWTESVWLER